jgi:phage portal protein BeeE
MNIFNPFKPRPAKNAVTLPQSFSFGKASSGETITEQTTLNTSAVYACVCVVSEAIASLPLWLYKDTSNEPERCPEYLLHDILTVPRDCNHYRQIKP